MRHLAVAPPNGEPFALPGLQNAHHIGQAPSRQGVTHAHPLSHILGGDAVTQ
jgi:hypothetical protein